MFILGGTLFWVYGIGVNGSIYRDSGHYQQRTSATPEKERFFAGILELLPVYFFNPGGYA